MMKTIPIKVGIGTLVAASLLLVSLLSPAHAQNDAMSEARTIATFGLMSPRLLSALNLTTEQNSADRSQQECFQGRSEGLSKRAQSIAERGRR